MAYRAIGRRIDKIDVKVPEVATVGKVYSEMVRDFEMIMTRYRIEPTYKMVYRAFVLRIILLALRNRTDEIKRTYEMAIRAGLRKDVIDELMNLARRHLSKYIKVTF